MNQITVLNTEADQLVFVPQPDGSVLQLEFIYRPAIERWSLNVSHPSLTINGFILCVAPNILRQWKNVTKFGIAVTSTDGYDPVDINDFATGRISVFMLSADETALVESQIVGQAA